MPMSNAANILTENNFEGLFRQHFSALTAFAYRYLRDWDEAKELVHDVYVTLWEKRDSIDPNKAIRSYLFTAVYNRSMNHLRDNKKFNRNVDASQAADIIASGNNNALELKELEKQISSAIAQLPEKCREVFMMNRYDGLKYKEIAEALNISVKTVEIHMTKALKVLREQLQKNFILLIMSVLTEINK